LKKQPASKAIQKTRRAPKQRKERYSRLVEFPEVKRLTVEKLALSADSDFPCISIRFQDNTDLTVVIDPWLTFQADYFEVEGREPEGAQALAVVPQRWHVKNDHRDRTIAVSATAAAIQTP
jgi:hypothetical protein